MTIGIRGYDQPRQVTWLSGLMVLPFRGQISGYVINRRQWSSAEDSIE
jgi:hypothetical protein